MKNKFHRRQFDLKIKSANDDSGAFSGYGSVFGNADSYRDVVMPGAFAVSLQEWAAKDALPPVLWQHRSDQPIGIFTKMNEDAKGLAVEGQLLVGQVKKANEAQALIKAGAISGMSIGFNVVKETYNGKLMVNEIQQIELWEVSIVTFPANQSATITSIKSIIAAGEMPTIREFEDILRDAGYSRKHSAKIASLGYAKFLALRDADEEKPDDQKSLDEALALIGNFSTK